MAPDILLFANLGAVQLNYGYTVDHFRRAVPLSAAARRRAGWRKRTDRGKQRVVGAGDARASRPFLEAGRERLLRDADWLDTYLEELKTFPYSDYTDLTDVTTMAVNHTRDDEGGGGEILGMGVVGGDDDK